MTPSVTSPRHAVMGPPVATEILTAGGVHALALLAGGSEDRKQRVAAANSLYFMGWLTEQIRCVRRGIALHKQP